jgi:hypothetical protein
MVPHFNRGAPLSWHMKASAVVGRCARTALLMHRMDGLVNERLEAKPDECDRLPV